jgi:hypothetical protein
MTVYGDALSAIRARFLAIGVTALASGIAAFAITYYTTPRIDVVGFVEIARYFHVDADGNVREEPTVPAVVLAGQVNSGAFFDVSAIGSEGEPVRVARIIARVPPRTENLEVSARVETAAQGRQALTELVRRMNAAHVAQQQVVLGRLQKRQATLQSEMEELLKARRELENTVKELSRSGGTKEGVQSFIVVSLRSQLNKDLRELERMRQSTAEAIAQMKERQTGIIGNLVPQRASVLPCLAIGMVFGLLGALVAATIVVARVHWRGAASHD